MKDTQFHPELKRRKIYGWILATFCSGAACLALFLLVVLIWDIAHDGLGSINRTFISSFPSRFPTQAGIKAGLFGTLWLMVLTALFSLPVGIGAAIYLEEYASKHWYTKLININISNLAGVPSIVYGILGLAIFVRWFSLGRSVLSGALTMTLLILPVIVTASREAIKATPDSIRMAAFALGATQWQTTRDHVLPASLPGIMTGVILALSRAMGETAPLIMIGAVSYIAFVPKSPMDAFTALPIQIFNWASRPSPAFHALAAGGIIILLIVLLGMNATAIFLRYRYQKNLKW